MTGVRLDKWLWAARFFKTRALSSDEIGKGRVSVNGQLAKPSREVRIGDNIELRQSHVPRTVVVKRTQQRARAGAGGPGALRRDRWKHRTAQEARGRTSRLRRAGSTASSKGRPTKRDRRQLADWNRWSASVDPD